MYIIFHINSLQYTSLIEISPVPPGITPPGIMPPVPVPVPPVIVPPVPVPVPPVNRGQKCTL